MTFTAPDGTEYELRDQQTGGEPLNTEGDSCDSGIIDRAQIFVTTDGTSATFVSDTSIKDNPFTGAALMLPTGTLYLSNGLSYRIVNGQVQTMRDRNGNQITFQYQPPVSVGPGLTAGPGLMDLASVTDSLGRMIQLSSASASLPYDEIVYPGFGGTSRSIRVWHSSLVDALRQDFAGSGPQTKGALFPELYAVAVQNDGVSKTSHDTVVNFSVIKAVELPDGRRYRFSYNPYGELARVDLPTGGAYEYDYGSGIPTSTSGVFQAAIGEWEVYRRVIQRRVYPDGTSAVPESIERFNHEEFPDSATSLPQTRVTDEVKTASGALLSLTKHYFFGQTSLDFYRGILAVPFNEGKEFKTEAYDLDRVAVLRTTLTNWGQAPAACPLTAPVSPLNLPFPLSQGYAYNPRVQDVTTTLETGQSYKATYNYDCFNNVTETDEFDFGATTPTRTTLNTYLSAQTVGGVPVDYVDIVPPPSTTPTLHMRRLLTRKMINDNRGSTVAVTNYNYDENTSSISDEPGIVGHSAGFSASYHTRGNQTSVTSYTNASALSGPVTSTAAYDVAGSVISRTDPNHNVTAYTYDSTGGAFAFVNSITLPIPGLHGSSSAMAVHKTNDFNTGQVTSFADLNGNVTRYDYTDPLDRPVNVTYPDGGGATFIYGDTVGDLNVHVVTALDSSRNMETYTYFDGLGRKIRTLELDGTAGTPWIATAPAYDGMGRVAAVTNPHRVSQPSAVPSDCSTARCTATAYDALSRIFSVATPDGQSVITRYAGNSMRLTDQAGNTKDELTDALGRLVQVIENPTNVNGDGSPVTTYAYDALNNLLCAHQKGIDPAPDPKTCSDPAPPAWRPRNFTYDSLSRLLTASNPESGTSQYGYDSNGNLTSKSDANHTTITTTYDALNRPATVTYNDNGRTPALTYFYDGNPNPVLNPVGNSLGRLSLVSSADPSSGDYSFDKYDAMGGVLGTTQKVDGQSYAMTYAYDLAGHMVNETYPSGRVVQTGYDAAGRVSSVTAPRLNPSPYADQIQYSAHGAITDLLLGNGLWEHTGFDANRLQTTEIDVGSTRQGTDLLSLQYDYQDINGKNNGNVRRQMIMAPGLAATQLVQYDGLNRLAKMQEVTGNTVLFPFQSSPVWEQDFAHDFWGNRTGLVSTGFIPVAPTVAPDANNRIDVTQNSGYSYDAAGYLKTEPFGSGINTYSYDAEGRLIQAQDNAGTQTFKYDGRGHRVKKIAGSAATIYVRDVNGELIAEYSSVAPQNNGTRYLTQDILGSERLVTGTDSSNKPAVVARYDYLPFGELVPVGLSTRSSVTGYGATDASRQKFTGKERDAEDGLDYFDSRYSASSLGRFTSADTLLGIAADPQTLNRYTYARNNPLRFVDPSGHLPGQPDDKGEAVVKLSVTAPANIPITDPKRQNRLTALEALMENYWISDNAASESSPILLRSTINDHPWIEDVVPIVPGELPPCIEFCEGVEGARGLPLIKGKTPRNGQYAGKLYPMEKLSAELQEKYPEGVQFNEGGFPDLSPYAKAVVQVDGLNGNQYHDEGLANAAAGYRQTPVGYTWHHVEDTVTMQLVPTDLHRAVGHTGGRSIIDWVTSLVHFK